MIVNPNFDAMVDTAQDIIDRNMSVFTGYAGMENFKEALNGSGIAVYKELGKLVKMPQCTVGDNVQPGQMAISGQKPS